MRPWTACRPILFLFVMCVPWHVIVLSVAGAQDTQPLSVEDVLGVQQFAQLMPIAASRETNWLAYTAQDGRRARSIDAISYARNGVAPWSSGTSIWILNVETGATKALETDADNWLPCWSPNGHYLAFLSNRDGDGQARLWIWDTIRKETRRVSNLDVRGNKIEWTPDSQKVFVTNVPQELSAEDYVKKLSFGTDQEKQSGIGASNSTVVLYKSDGDSHDGKTHPKADPWNLDLTLRDLSSIEINSGSATTLVHGKRIAAYFLSPDGSRIAYTIQKHFDKPGSQQILFDLAMFTIGTDREQILASDLRLDYDGAALSWSPDGSQISFRTGGMEDSFFDCYVVDVEAGTMHNVTNFSSPAASHRKSAIPLWDQKGRIYVIHNGGLWRTSLAEGKAAEVAHIPDREIVQTIPHSGSMLWVAGDTKSTIVLTHDNVGMQDGFYRVDLESGKSTALQERNQCYTCANVSTPLIVTGDGKRVAYFAEDSQHDEDLWISDVTFQNPWRLTHLNPQFDKHKLGAAQPIEWLDDDGEELRGTLLLPAGYRKGVRYPLIVWVYGSSSLSNNLDHFGVAYRGPFNMQLLATRGYAILLPDAPQNLGTPMLDLAKTVLPGVSKVIEMGIADPDRLGVMGHSYGGYSTLSLIVQTKRFKAAVSLDGMGDMVGAYGQMRKDGTAFGTSMEEQGSGLMGDTPWQVRERYVENSPIFYLDRVETPLLIVHGSNDTTVAPFLGDEMFVDLRRLGREVVYAKYEGEGHSPLSWSHGNQVDLCNRMIAWFEAHLKN